MEGQMNLFDLIERPIEPGDWVDEEQLGDEISFDEIADKYVNKIIIISKFTKSLKAYKAVMVEKIIPKEENGGKYRRLVYYDGVKQRGMIDESYFSKMLTYPVYAWEVKNNGRTDEPGGVEQ